MKTALFVLVFGVSFAYGQQNATSSATAPGCGSETEKFNVSATRGQHPMTQPEPGKALVYVIQDDTHFESRPRPTTRVGVDGKWIGATHSNSYLYSSLEPGEHHLCVRWQSFVGIGMGHKAAALHFTAEAGKSYYFRVKDTWLREHGGGDIDFDPLDSDKGQLLTSKLSVSTSRPQK